MNTLTVEFRGMHLFVFDDEPARATHVTVYACPGTGHERHRSVAMINLSAMAKGASWQGDFAAGIPGSGDWLGFVNGGQVQLRVGGKPIPAQTIARADAVAGNGVSLKAAKKGGTGKVTISGKVNASIALTGGTLKPEPATSPRLGEFKWQVDDDSPQPQCLSDHVSWTYDVDAREAVEITIGKERLECEHGKDVCLVFSNFPESQVNPQHPSQRLEHITSLYDYADGSAGYDVVVTGQECDEWAGLVTLRGGFPVECPYAWGRR